MAETDLHRNLMVRLINLLQRFFSGRQAYVSGNLLLYYEEGNIYKSVAPDCFIALGIEQRDRRIYQTWVEGKVPDVVFEISSNSTQREDLGKKMRLYAELGIREYFIYDPTGDYLVPPLRAFELHGDGYVPMQEAATAVDLGPLAFVPGAGEPPEFSSAVLGLRVALDEENRLQLFDTSTGQRLLTDEEALVQAEAENERLRAELVRLRGERES
ncbi:MAG: Uma2 family endonuclease, partial [Caldilineaceae bacterium]|nr:Uma2 family endonuclease [Caldilineaceae bacterium]